MGTFGGRILLEEDLRSTEEQDIKEMKILVHLYQNKCSIEGSGKKGPSRANDFKKRRLTGRQLGKMNLRLQKYFTNSLGRMKRRFTPQL
uniref:Uncharacterized protein n=1 Tax=Lactuca sativa TaxID=4236 RepID=A0A9R1WPL4_LACSA|nr:hypothetical protein LSAT_V11C100018620 [Lactuca sativa]